MNVEGLMDMRGNQIVVSAHGSGRIRLGGDGRLGHEALDGCKVLGLLPSSKSPPGLCQSSSGARGETPSGATDGLFAIANYSPFLADNGVLAFRLRRRCCTERDGQLKHQHQQQKWPPKAPGEGS